MSAKPVKPKPQHAPKAPHEDPKFLESTPARPLRILAEYINPLAQLKREGIGDTIVMFGSARIHSREDTLSRLDRLKKVKAGQGADSLQNLQPGQYLFLCFVPSADGIPHLAKGMIKPLQVTGASPAATNASKHVCCQSCVPTPGVVGEGMRIREMSPSRR